MITRLTGYLALAAIAILGFTNCKKSTDTPANFSPLTAGSTWTYNTNTSGNFTLTATNRDTVANGRTYRVLTNSGGPNNYVAKVNNDYYRFGVFAAIGNTGIEELYLKDNVDVNGTWVENRTIPYQVSAVPPVTLTVPITLTYVVKERGVDKTVSGKNYTNVMHVKLNITSSTVGALGDGDFYYADGIGLIDQTINVYANSVAGIAASTNTQSLTSFSIK